jgi:hypothetical protein
MSCFDLLKFDLLNPTLIKIKDVKDFNPQNINGKFREIKAAH